MSFSVTILGCGFSGGVPRPGLGWGHCDPNNPKNRRRRCSILVERTAQDSAKDGAQDGGKDGGKDSTRVLVDTSPDLREQLLDAGVDWVDGVLYTHEHADHTHGIDDLRGLFLAKKRRIDVYSDEATWRVLDAALRLLLHDAARQQISADREPAPDRPRRARHHRRPGRPGHRRAALQDHGDIASLGYRFGAMAYSSDLVDLPPESVELLSGIELWIVDALWYKPHPSHFHLDLTLEWIDRIKPKRAILTNMHSDLDYEELCTRLPANVVPAYDGLRTEFAG